jgi:hypothetical protein
MPIDKMNQINGIYKYLSIKPIFLIPEVVALLNQTAFKTSLYFYVYQYL